MRHVEIPVYKFSELSREAKDRAKAYHAEVFGYSWSDEALNSLMKLTEHFRSKLLDYNIDFFGYEFSYVKFKNCEITEGELSDLVDSLKGDCVLTGYAFDSYGIEGVMAAYSEGIRNVVDLLQRGFQTWLNAVQKDCKHQYEDEEFAEMSEANGWEYTCKGELFREKDYLI